MFVEIKHLSNTCFVEWLYSFISPSQLIHQSVTYLFILFTSKNCTNRVSSVDFKQHVKFYVLIKITFFVCHHSRSDAEQSVPQRQGYENEFKIIYQLFLKV